MALDDDFTLVIPTYNRPAEVARLLRYLARHAVRFPILMLDSGDASSRAVNAALAGTLGLRIRLISYDAGTHPFDKFGRGVKEVGTQFCALCADDDVVLVDAFPPLVAFLNRNPDFVAAHGWYFTFCHGRHVDIPAVAYRAPSIEQAQPLERLRAFVDPYEAPTYAVYRTSVAREVLSGAQGVDSLLARELLAGALTVLAGKVARLPLLYYGRSLEPPGSSTRSHPLALFLTSADGLFREYQCYRRIVLDRLCAIGHQGRDRQELGRLLDLIHLRYLSAYLLPEVMDYLIAETMAATDHHEILLGMWPRLNPSPSRMVNRLRKSRRLRRLRDRLVPAFRLRNLLHVLGIAGNQTIRATTAGGLSRQYRLHPAFLGALRVAGFPNVDGAVDEMIRTLHAYE